MPIVFGEHPVDVTVNVRITQHTRLIRRSIPMALALLGSCAEADMKPTDRRESQPSTTAEIGSEGGSYAEPLNQTATFSGPANPNISPADAIAGKMSVATETAARGPLAGTSLDIDDETAGGMVRYPTEPPSPPDAREGRRMTGHPWRNGLVGLAAGTAALIGASRLRRRS